MTRSASPEELIAESEHTLKRIGRLQAYMGKKVLSRGRFRCISEDDCRRDCPSGNDFWEGQLSHVGHHYDLISAGKTLRIAVIGKDNGRGPARIGLTDRYKSVHDFRSSQFASDRNPHIRGVTLALKTVFGIDLRSEDPTTEVLTTSKGESFHIFDAYALVNALLCSCTKPGDSSTSAWRSTMRHNCQRHLKETLAILEPTLIITQGKSMHDQTPLGPLLTDRRWVGEHLFEATIPGGSRAVVCAFSHPYQVGHQDLAWWRADDNYVELVLRPTLRGAKKRLPRAGS